MLDFYIHQHEGYGIGNFINCTPTIRRLYEKTGELIPVNYSMKVVEKLFEDCEFTITISDKQAKNMKKLFDSSMVNHSMPDYKYIYQNIIGDSEPVPHTYVPSYPIPEEYKNRDYIVIVRGCDYRGHWLDKKDPGDDIYKYIIDTIKDEYDIVLIGADVDNERFYHYMKDWTDNISVELNDVQKSIGLIRGSECVVCNDTGMYHAAGALNHQTFILWKDTPFKKNQSPGKNCFYSRKGNWKRDWDRYIYE